MGYINTLIHGQPTEKLKLCFDLIDSHKRGFITMQDLLEMVISVLQANHPDASPEEHEYRSEKIGSYLFRNFHEAQDGKVDFVAFSNAVEKDPNILEMFTLINKGISEAIIMKTIEEDRVNNLLEKMRKLNSGLREVAFKLSIDLNKNGNGHSGVYTDDAG